MAYNSTFSVVSLLFEYILLRLSIETLCSFSLKQDVLYYLVVSHSILYCFFMCKRSELIQYYIIALLIILYSLLVNMLSN